MASSKKITKIPLAEFKRIYAKVPRLCVDLVVRNSQGAILLSKRDIPPKKGWWHFPGGTVLMGERLEDTVYRVAQEELNSKVKLEKLLGINEYDRGGGLGYPIAVVFSVKLLSKQVRGGEQSRSIGYFTKTPDKTLYEVNRFVSEHLK